MLVVAFGPTAAAIFSLASVVRVSHALAEDEDGFVDEIMATFPFSRIQGERNRTNACVATSPPIFDAFRTIFPSFFRCGPLANIEGGKGMMTAQVAISFSHFLHRYLLFRHAEAIILILAFAERYMNQFNSEETISPRKHPPFWRRPRRSCLARPSADAI